MPPFRAVRQARDTPIRLRALIGCLALVALGACPSAAVAGDPSPSRSERDFTRLLNAERVAQGLSRVEISPALTAIADDYVLHNERAGGITHARDAPYTALANAVGCGKWLGPVLGIAYPSYPSVRSVLDGWLSSSGHRAVVLDPEITHIGVGLRRGHAVAFGMPCVRNAANTSGDYGDPRPVAPAPPVLASGPGAAAQARSRPRAARRRPSPCARCAPPLVVARSASGSGWRPARHVFAWSPADAVAMARGRWVLLRARQRSYLLAVKVPKKGRWRIYLSSRAGAIALGSVRVRRR